MSRRREWPNRLGFDLSTGAGTWSFASPDFHRTLNGQWHAVYVRRGQVDVSRRGSGATPETARANAVRVEE